MLAEALTFNIIVFMLAFSRIGTAMMLLPGFGDAFVNPTLRLQLALALTLVLTPFIAVINDIAPPQNPVAFLLMVVPEVMIGVLIGISARILLNALNFAGLIISHGMAFANTMVFNPQMSSQSTVISTMLTLLAVVLIFATDLHHMLLIAVVGSYKTFPVGILPELGDVVETMAELLALSFRVGMQIAAPFLIVSMGIFLAMGIMARLIPQIQIFFLAMPIQIMIGFLLLMAALGAMMSFFLDNFTELFAGLFALT